MQRTMLGSKENAPPRAAAAAAAEGEGEAADSSTPGSGRKRLRGDDGSESQGRDVVVVPLELESNSNMSTLSNLDASRIDSLETAKAKLGSLLEDRRRMKRVLRQYYAADNSLLCESSGAGVALEPTEAPAAAAIGITTAAAAAAAAATPLRGGEEPTAGRVVVRVFVVVLDESRPERALVRVSLQQPARLFGGEPLRFHEDMEECALRQLDASAGPGLREAATETALYRVENSTERDRHDVNMYMVVTVRDGGQVALRNARNGGDGDEETLEWVHLQSLQERFPILGGLAQPTFH